MSDETAVHPWDRVADMLKSIGGPEITPEECRRLYGQLPYGGFGLRGAGRDVVASALLELIQDAEKKAGGM